MENNTNCKFKKSFSLPVEFEGSPTLWTNGDKHSPMTNLAFNLEELSTGINGTPKRRISWSSTDGTPPVCRPMLLKFKETPSPENLVERYLMNKVINSKSRVQTKPKLLMNHGELVDKENNPLSNAKNDGDSIEDGDCSSRDSGFSERPPFHDECVTSVERTFQFSEPVSVRLNPKLSNEQSVKPLPIVFSKPNVLPESDVQISEKPIKDLSCGEDGFDCFDLDIENDQFTSHDNQLPSGLSSLLYGPMPSSKSLGFSPAKSNGSPSKPLNVSPSKSVLTNVDCNTNRTNQREGRNFMRDQLNSEYKLKCPFKRPDPPLNGSSPVQVKRKKSLSSATCYGENLNDEKPRRVLLQRCHSETEATIKTALQRSSQNPDLIGDFSKGYILPMSPGRHNDLKTITAYTLSRLMYGEYADEVESYKVIDCRYPYEYDGGHIKNALNYFSKETILQELLLKPNSPPSSKRNICIFHCEYSSERGPNLLRFLRNKDRDINKDCYPNLYFPELYLLNGGYKAFYKNYKELCEPQSYMPMLHKDHEQDLRHFRAKSKSWSGDKCRIGVRPGLKF